MGSILLVESDPDTRDRVGTAMREAGHEVLVATTMREALLRVSEGGIDAVVADSYDPRVGIVELARSLDALPDAPPIVIVSASPHAPEISARIGAAAFIAKPVDLDDLVRTMSRLVGEVRPVRMIEDEAIDETENAPTVSVRSAFEDEDPTGPVRSFG